MSLALLTGGMIYPIYEACIPEPDVVPIVLAQVDCPTTTTVVADITPPPPPPPAPPVVIKPETQAVVCPVPDVVIQATEPGEAQPPSPPAPPPTPSIKPIIRVSGNGWLKKDPKIRPR